MSEVEGKTERYGKVEGKDERYGEGAGCRGAGWWSVPR